MKAEDILDIERWRFDHQMNIPFAIPTLRKSDVFQGDGWIRGKLTVANIELDAFCKFLINFRDLVETGWSVCENCWNDFNHRPPRLVF